MKNLKGLIFGALVLGLCLFVNPNKVLAECSITNKETLETAINDANGGTIKLCQSIDVTTYVTVSKDVTIDLNGFTISRNGNATGSTVFNITGGNVVFEDSKGNGGVTLTNPVANSQTIQVHGGNVTLKAGKYTNAGGAAINVYDSANLTIEGTSELVGTKSDVLDCTVQVYGGGKLIVDGNAKISGAKMGIFAQGEKPSVTIKGGEISGTETGITSAIGTENFEVIMSGGKVTGGYGIALIGNNATLTMTNGVVEAEGMAISGNGSGTTNSTININGGSVISKTNAAIYQPQTGKLNITNGKITGKIGIVARQGDVVISGGTITATGKADEKIRVGDSKEGSDYVQLPTGVAVVVDNTNSSGYADDANVTITNGNINGDVNSLLSYGETKATEAEFVVSGGSFNNPVKTEYLISNVQQSENGVVGKVHKITTTKSKNGTVKLPSNAAEGETVTVEYTANKGFVLNSIVVKKADGTKVKVVGGKFVMPAGDVTVTVTFKDEKNPATGDNLLTYVSLGAIALISTLGTSLYLKKVNE